MIKVEDVLATRRKVIAYREMSTKFERDFMRSITDDKKIYNESRIWPNILDMSSKKEYISLTQKQQEVFLNIERKYKQYGQL